MEREKFELQLKEAFQSVHGPYTAFKRTVSAKGQKIIIIENEKIIVVYEDDGDIIRSIPKEKK